MEEEQREKVSGNDNKLFTARELASKQALTLGADSAVDRETAEQQRGRAADRDAARHIAVTLFVPLFVLPSPFVFALLSFLPLARQSCGDTVAPASVAFVQQPARQQKACQPFL